MAETFAVPEKDIEVLIMARKGNLDDYIHSIMNVIITEDLEEIGYILTASIDVVKDPFPPDMVSTPLHRHDLMALTAALITNSLHKYIRAYLSLASAIYVCGFCSECKFNINAIANHPNYKKN